MNGVLGNHWPQGRGSFGDVRGCGDDQVSHAPYSRCAGLPLKVLDYKALSPWKYLWRSLPSSFHRDIYTIIYTFSCSLLMAYGRVQ